MSIGNQDNFTVEGDISRLMFGYGSRTKPDVATSDAWVGPTNGMMLMMFLIPIIVICFFLCLGSNMTRSSQSSPEENTPEGVQKKKEDVESRKKKILQSFEANSTSMVRK
jgi:hypothetical protein